jgi:phosphatidylinositol-3,4,5-trisphosphate 3-phosphatase/dual-specificity protein phosphatase PTEN
MEIFCADVATYLNEDPANVVAIHCKAGKGRTGLMICVFLIYAGVWTDAQQALSYYGFARTENQKGVTIASQIRYVYYFQDYFRLRLAGKSLPVRRSLVLVLLPIMY